MKEINIDIFRQRRKFFSASKARSKDDGHLGPLQPFFSGGVKIASGGGSLRDPWAAPPLAPPLCPRMILYGADFLLGGMIGVCLLSPKFIVS